MLIKERLPNKKIKTLPLWVKISFVFAEFSSFSVAFLLASSHIKWLAWLFFFASLAVVFVLEHAFADDRAICAVPKHSGLFPHYLGYSLRWVFLAAFATVTLKSLGVKIL